MFLQPSSLTLSSCHSIGSNKSSYLHPLHCLIRLNVTIYLCTLEAEDLYPMIEIARFAVPSSMETLPLLLMELEKLKQSMHVYDNFCVKRKPGDPVTPTSWKRLSLSASQLADVLRDFRDPTIQLFIEIYNIY